MDKYNIKFNNQKFAEDCIFNLDYISKCDRVAFIKDANYYYYENRNSTTRKYDKEKFKEKKVGYNEVIKKLKELNICEDTISGINSIFLGNVRACIKQEINNEKETALNNIKKICNDKLVQKVLHERYKQTVKQKVFDFFIKTKKVNMLYFIISKVYK